MQRIHGDGSQIHVDGGMKAMHCEARCDVEGK
jgi:hypothetical protein